MSRTREQVGDAFRTRREAKGISQETISRPSSAIVSRIENGQSTSAKSERLLAISLGWPADAYQRLLDGEDPATFPTVEVNRVAILAALDRIEASVSILRDELESGG